MANNLDTRLACMKVIQILMKRHPFCVPTHKIYSELGLSDRLKIRNMQRQIKHLVDIGYVERVKDNKIKLSEKGKTEWGVP